MLMNKPLKKLTSILFLISIIYLATGCDSNVLNPSADNFSLSIATPTVLAKSSVDSLTFTSVKLLIRDIKFEQEGTNGEESELKVGPFVVNLDLTGITNTVTVMNIPSGTYDEIVFKIHKADENETPPDPEFKEGNNSDQRYSVIVKGTFNGNPFEYKSKKSAEQKIKLTAPVVIDASKSINLTLEVDPSKWFDNNGSILNPSDSSNANIIDGLIHDSFKNVFEDDDKDGNPDD